MDLVGMSLREERKKRKVTILRQNGNKIWNRVEINLLVGGLKPFILGGIVVIHQLPKMRDVVMIMNEFTKEQVSAVLGGYDDFQHEVITGLDNSALPFPVPSC